jgi:SAM-dependent methyltransferase
MTSPTQDTGAANGEKFDSYARSYDELHAESIAASGESTEYFALHKIGCLARLGTPTGAPILDYGCGIGNLTEQLVKSYREVHGFDPSRASLKVCQQRAPGSVLHEESAAVPDGYFATAVLSGVLHHVRPHERIELLRTVHQKLAPGGRVVIFEHNPLNPLTRRAVDTCPFDDDAILLYPSELPRLLSVAGFRRVDLDYVVFFPKPLAFLRPLEPALRRVFLGAQTMTVGER